SFSGDGRTLHLNSGRDVEADMTLLAIGIKPNTAIAEEASLDIGETGALKVNEFMQTNDPDIYALGDVVETRDFLTGSARHVALASPAHRQAFIIANHIHGKALPYKGVSGSAILKVFDLDVGATGLNSAQLHDQEIDFKEATHDALSHAGYYPGAEKVSLKILFDPETGTIYGGQVVGKDGVDKR